MKYLSYFFWLAILAGFNFGFFSNLTFFGATPNLLLGFVVLAASLKEGIFEKLFVALIAGLFADYFSGGFFGGFVFSFLCLCLLVQASKTSLTLVEMDWKYFLSILIFSYIFTGLFVWCYNFMAFRLHWSEFYASFFGFIKRWPWEMAYSLVLFLPVKRFFEFIQKINNRYFEIGSRWGF